MEPSRIVAAEPWPAPRRADVASWASRLSGLGVRSFLVRHRLVAVVREAAPGAEVMAYASCPLGSSVPDVKVLSAKLAVEAGADKVVVCLNPSLANSGAWEDFRKEAEQLAEAVGPERLVLCVSSAITGQAFVRALKEASSASPSAIMVDFPLGGEASPDAVSEAAKVYKSVIASAASAPADRVRLLLNAGAARAATTRAEEVLAA